MVYILYGRNKKMPKKYNILFLFILIYNIICAQDSIYWNKNSKLNFQDFKLKNPKSSFKATSSLSRRIESVNEEDSLIIAVQTVFIKSKSWITILDSSLLIHENKHFDLLEIYNRILRKKIFEYSFNYDSFNKDFDGICDYYFKLYLVVEAQYDKESDLSRDDYCQSWWNKYIDEQLKALEAYSNPVVKLRIKEE